MKSVGFLFIFLAAGQLWAQNFLENPGFEVGDGPLPQAWQHYQPTYQSAFGSDRQIFHEGSRALRLTGVAGVALSISSKEVLLPAKSLVMGAWVCGRISKGRAMLRLREVDRQGSSIRYRDMNFPVGETWGAVVFEVPDIDPRCHRVQCYVTLESVVGTLWFDDMYLGEKKPEWKAGPGPNGGEGKIFHCQFQLPFLLPDEKIATHTGPFVGDFLTLSGGAGLKLSGEKGRGAAGSFEKSFDRLMPGERFEASATMKIFGKTRGFLVMHFEDGEHRELHRVEVEATNTAASEAAGHPTTIFTVPEKTCFVKIAARMENPTGGGGLTLGEMKLLKLKTEMPPATPGYWRALWISVHDGDREIQGATYYRRAWVLAKGRASRLTKALLLLASNMGSTLTVNGVVVGKSDSWRHAKIFDLAPFLVEGTNVIGVMPVNTRASSRVLLEASMDFSDGVEETLLSDQNWRASKEFHPGWDTAVFDGDKFGPVYLYGRPPIGPYGDLPYPSLVNPKRVGVDGLLLPSNMTPGELGSLSLSIPQKGVDLNETSLGFSKAGVDIFSIPVEWSPTGSAHWSGSFRLPAFVPGTNYEVAFQNKGFYFYEGLSNRLARPVEIRPSGLPTNVFGAALAGNAYTQGGATTRELLFAYKNPIDIDPMPRLGDAGDFYAAGGNTLVLQVYRDASMAVAEKLDRTVMAVLAKFPRASLVISLATDPDSKWLGEHPGAQVVYGNGESGPHASLASPEYFAEIADYVEAAVAHLARSPYRQRIMGVELEGGEDAQWMHHSGYRSKLPDYSQPMLQYFRHYLEQKYRSPDALAKSWKAPGLDFDSAQIPRPAQRSNGTDGIFWDPTQSMAVIDFNSAYSKVAADLLMSLAKKAKGASGGRFLVGAYYFMAFGASFADEFGMRSLGDILRCPDLDLLGGPNYAQRAPGLPDAFPGPVDSLGLHQKNHWKEEDLRTYLSAQKYQKLDSVFETYSVIKRDAALAITKGTGLWFYDLHGGWFRGEMIRELFKNCRDIMEKREAPPFRAEVAVFVDDEVLNCVSKTGEGLMRALYAYEQKTYLGQFGAPYDAYHLSDLDLVSLKTYKIVIFLNAFKLSPRQRSVLTEKYQKDKRTLVWVYAPGLIKDEGEKGLTLSHENCGEVTGMGMKRATAEGNLMVRYVNSGAPPWLPSGDAPYGYKEKLSPRFVVADDHAKVLGHYLTGEAALAVRHFPEYTSVFSGAPALPPALLAALAKEAGVHLYGAAGDGVYACETVFAIHAQNEGSKILTFPKPVDIYNPFLKTWVTRGRREVTVPMIKGQTELWVLSPPGGSP